VSWFTLVVDVSKAICFPLKYESELIYFFIISVVPSKWKIHEALFILTKKDSLLRLDAWDISPSW